jgi:hypothetical protein
LQQYFIFLVTAIHYRTADFVRGFFNYFESLQLRAAVLHGGDDGFERKLSDVDFVVSKDAFEVLPTLIDAYCNQSAWRLCQILRHETTAAYFVCSAADDPACAVALDACSDYQRNGTLFLTAESLLKNRNLLPWGGYCLAPATELCYRFAKAAAKSKDTAASADEFATYPEDVRRDCATWLEAQWGIFPKSWDAAVLASSLTRMREKSNLRPSLTQSGALDRIASRIHHPTGLIVIVGRDDSDAIATSLEQVFGHLYFRRIRKAGRWQPAMLKDLVASTLIILPEIGAVWAKLIPADCIHRLDPSQDSDNQCKEVAKHLHERCRHREAR